MGCNYFSYKEPARRSLVLLLIEESTDHYYFTFNKEDTS